MAGANNPGLVSPFFGLEKWFWSLGHPMIFDREAFSDLRRLHGDKAVWKLIEAYPKRILRVNIDAKLPLDVETPIDYEQVLIEMGYKSI
jgi:molybdenum cofactor cytidylyltransferase